MTKFGEPGKIRPSGFLFRTARLLQFLEQEQDMSYT
jgi:hypothetical protein